MVVKRSFVNNSIGKRRGSKEKTERAASKRSSESVVAVET